MIFHYLPQFWSISSPDRLILSMFGLQYQQSHLTLLNLKCLLGNNVSESFGPKHPRTPCKRKDFLSFENFCLPSIRFVASSVSFFKIFALDISRMNQLFTTYTFQIAHCDSLLVRRTIFAFQKCFPTLTQAFW